MASSLNGGIVTRTTDGLGSIGSLDGSAELGDVDDAASGVGADGSDVQLVAVATRKTMSATALGALLIGFTCAFVGSLR